MGGLATGARSRGHGPYRMFANSLLMRFSSSSRALAFLRSAMNWTRPRMFELLELDLPRKPAVEDMVGGGGSVGAAGVSP